MPRQLFLAGQLHAAAVWLGLRVLDGWVFWSWCFFTNTATMLVVWWLCGGFSFCATSVMPPGPNGPTVLVAAGTVHCTLYCVVVVVVTAAYRMWVFAGAYRQRPRKCNQMV